MLELRFNSHAVREWCIICKRIQCWFIDDCDHAGKVKSKYWMYPWRWCEINLLHTHCPLICYLLEIEAYLEKIPVNFLSIAIIRLYLYNSLLFDDDIVAYIVEMYRFKRLCSFPEALLLFTIKPSSRVPSHFKSHRSMNKNYMGSKRQSMSLKKQRSLRLPAKFRTLTFIDFFRNYHGLNF